MERIDALLEQSESCEQISYWYWAWLVLTFLPLAAIPFHS